jgi:hypothetical protein
MTTIWLLPVVYNLEKGSLHTICNINNLTISHHMPCKNKLDTSNFSCIFYVVWGFLGRTILIYEHITTTVIKILLKNLCKIDHNYSGRIRKATYAKACQVWDKSRECGHVMLVSGSFNPTMPLWSNNTKIAITWSSTPTTPCVLIMHNIYA